MTDSVTVLSHPTALATKRFHLGPDKRTLTEPYGEGKYFRAETIPLEGLGDLHDLLELLAHDTRAFLVRGELIPGTQLDHCRRLKKQNGTDGPTLREIPRRWLMLDIDGAQITVDWTTPAGCAAAADALLGRLPMELRTAGHVWQASASAGMKSGARFHFWFWLDRPLGESDLERWGSAVNDAAGKKLLDLAVFRTIQPHYVAEPVFENVLNPVAQRLGYVPGVPAVLPKLSNRGEVWRRKLEPLYYESNDKIHDHIRDACASFFCTNGATAEDDVLRKALTAAVAKALELQERPDSDYTADRLETEIASGREFAATRVESGENLLLDGRGQPRGAVANIIDVMRAHEDWRGLLAWNIRVAEITFLRTSPWGSRGAWTDADSVAAASWFAKEKRMAVDDGTVLRAAQAMARAQEIDPVAEWLLALEWDGVSRLDRWLIAHCGAADDEYGRRVSRMFMIGAVARALIPGCKHDTVLVLQGETGCGKSTLVETLAGEWFAALTEEKDMLQKIHGPWLVELPELGPFRSMHHNRIKSFTSTPMDRFRAPYMRLPENRPRTCALVATLNPEGVGWQRDPTSARRFWPVNVGQIDRVAVAAARDQLFAEAVVAFKAGESWWVQDAKDPLFTARQDEVYAVDEWETLIARCLDLGAMQFCNGRRVEIVPKQTEFYMVDLLGAAFNKHAPDKRDQERAAAVLIRLGYINHGSLWRKK